MAEPKITNKDTNLDKFALNGLKRLQQGIDSMVEGGLVQYKIDGIFTEDAYRRAEEDNPEITFFTYTRRGEASTVMIRGKKSNPPGWTRGGIAVVGVLLLAFISFFGALLYRAISVLPK